MPDYYVRQGDCISSLARQNKMLPDTIWNAPENAELKQKRPSLNVLLPSDKLFIPDPAQKQVGCATDQKHKFLCKIAPCKLRLRVRILEADGSVTTLANKPYTLIVDDKTITGSTDGDGAIRQPIDAAAATASLIIEGRTFPIHLGALDPHDTISGIQARLTQCGYDSGAVDGIMGPITLGAINKFQTDQGIPLTKGDPDQQTISALKQLYGA